MRAPIVEVKRRLDGSRSVFACERALVEPGRGAVLVYVMDRSGTVHDVVLRPGMRTFAHYWMDRAYNVYHWLDGARTVAYYVNVGQVAAIDLARVEWTDYIVDVLIHPDRSVSVLDEDEIPADLDPRLRSLIERTTRDVVADAARIADEVETETRRLLDME